MSIKDLGVKGPTKIPFLYMGKDTKECRVISKEYRKLYLRSPPLDHREVGPQRLIQAGISNWSIVRMNQLLLL